MKDLTKDSGANLTEEEMEARGMFPVRAIPPTVPTTEELTALVERYGAITKSPGKLVKLRELLTGTTNFAKGAFRFLTRKERALLSRHPDFNDFRSALLLEALDGDWAASKTQLLALRWLGESEALAPSSKPIPSGDGTVTVEADGKGDDEY